MYESGIISNMSLRVYKLLEENGPLNTHNIKKLLSITSKEDDRKFEKNIVELQETMDITVNGASKRINKTGEPYGWLITEYSTIEQWMGEDTFIGMPQIERDEALGKLAAKIRGNLPCINDNNIMKLLGIKKPVKMYV